MKFKIFCALFLMIYSISAQEFSGSATYKTHRKSSIELDSTTMAANPGIQKQLEVQMRKMFQKTYILDFTKSESMFKQKQELDGPKVPKSNGLS